MTYTELDDRTERFFTLICVGICILYLVFTVIAYIVPHKVTRYLNILFFNIIEPLINPYPGKPNPYSNPHANPDPPPKPRHTNGLHRRSTIAE